MLKPVWEVIDKSSAQSRVRCNSLTAAMFAKKILEVENPNFEYEIKQFRIFDDTALTNLVENGLKNVQIRYTRDLMTVTTTEIFRVTWQLTHSGNISDIVITENYDSLNITLMNLVQPTDKAREIAMAVWTAHPKYEMYMDAIMSWRASDTIHYTPFHVKNMDRVPDVVQS